MGKENMHRISYCHKVWRPIYNSWKEIWKPEIVIYTCYLFIILNESIEDINQFITRCIYILSNEVSLCCIYSLPIGNKLQRHHHLKCHTYTYNASAKAHSYYNIHSLVLRKRRGGGGYSGFLAQAVEAHRCINVGVRGIDETLRTLWDDDDMKTAAIPNDETPAAAYSNNYNAHPMHHIYVPQQQQKQ